MSGKTMLNGNATRLFWQATVLAVIVILGALASHAAQIPQFTNPVAVATTNTSGGIGAPFGVPENVTAVNTGISEDSPYLTLDGLSLYFSRGQSGQNNIYVAVRSSTTAPFGSPSTARLDSVNTSQRQWPGSLSADQLTLYLHSDTRPGSGSADIWIATRPDVASDFSEPRLLPNVNSTAPDFDANVSADGLSLYFVSSRSPQTPIWVARRNSTAEDFGAPTNDEFAQIHSHFNFNQLDIGVGGLCISPDERTLYIYVEDDVNQSPARQLWVSTRSSKRDPFGPPGQSAFVKIHSGGGAEAPSVSGDGSEIFFASGRSGGQGSDDIWRATRETLDLEWSTYLGGSGTDGIGMVVPDGHGNVFVSVNTDSADFPFPTKNPQTGTDVAIVKFDADGWPLQHSYLVGNSEDIAISVATDPQGNVLVTGFTWSTDLGTTGVFDSQYNGGGMSWGDAFIAKMDAQGALLWFTYLGGTGQDYGWRIATDGDGNIYLTGMTDSTDFPTSGPYSSGFVGYRDIFVAKFSPDGQLLWSTILGGLGEDLGYGVALDPAGSVYVGGRTTSTDFPTTGPNSTSFHGGGYDGYIAKFTPAGQLLWSTCVGGTGDEGVAEVACDEASSIYVTGETTSSDFPTTDGWDTTYNGGSDAYVMNLGLDGAVRQFTFLGGSSRDAATALTLDQSGNVYLAGTSFSADFPTTGGGNTVNRRGSGGAIMATFDSSGNLVYSTVWGGSSSSSKGNLPRGIATDASGGVYVVGQTDSTDFPTTRGWQMTYGGGSWDGFITRFGLRPATTQPPQLSVTPPFLGLTILQGQSTTRPIEVRNIGGATAIYTIATTPTWISVQPTSGSAAAGESVTHIVSLATGDFPPGRYSGHLTIIGNFASSVDVPVDIVVEAPLGPVNLIVSNVDVAPVMPWQLSPGTPLSLWALVRNNGSESCGPFWLEVWGSRTGGLTLDRFLADSVWVPGLPDMRSYGWFTTTTLYSIPDGPYTVVYVADRIGEIAETNERDNRAAIRGRRILVIRPQTQADLVVEGFAMSPNPAQAGQTISLSGRVVNRGSERSGPFWIEFWGSSDWPHPSLHFFLCDSIYIPNLDTGASVELSAYPRQLYSVPTGVFQVGCFADRDDSINELDETNNYQFVDGQVFNSATLIERQRANKLLGADVAIVSADVSPVAPVQLAPGSTITLTTELANRGTGDTGPFWLEYWGSRDGGVTLCNFLAVSDHVANLAPGAQVRLATAKPLWGIPDGPYSVVVFADRPRDVSDSDLTNNRRVIAGKRLLVIRPRLWFNLVNMAVSQFNVSVGSWPQAVINGEVQNRSPDDSGPFWIEFWACPGDPDYPWFDRYLCDSIQVDNLAPHGVIDFSDYPRRVYDSLPPGEYAVICFMDRLGQLTDVDYTDNYQVVRNVSIPAH